MSIVFNGNQKSKEILEEIKSKISSIKDKPSLLIIRTGQDKIQLKFTEIKKKTAEKLGVQCDIIEYPDTASTNQLLDLMHKNTKGYTGLLIQLPIPKQIDTKIILDAIPYDKDVEGLSQKRFKELSHKIPDVYSPVAKGMIETTKYAVNQLGKEFKGLKAVVVGKGYLIGQPVSLVLQHLGAKVISVERNDPDLATHLKSADIIETGIGDPKFIKSSMIKEESIVIDAAFEIDDKGNIYGDTDSSISPKTAFYTPVPGGIGPLTVAYIFDNLLYL